MPAIKVQHDLSKADKPPARQPIPPAIYDALIVNSALGLTKQTGLSKFTIEYRLLKTAEGDETMSGRRVFQDYVYQAGADSETNGREAFRIRQLFDATGIAYTVDADGSFGCNTDHMHNKPVRITVTQRSGKQPDAHGVIPVFNNVDRVDIATALDESTVI
jgi:hypothetical protein